MSSGEEEVCLTTLGRSYTVDLTAMQQLNDHTGTARPVQRVAPAPPAADAAAAAAAPGTLYKQNITLANITVYLQIVNVYTHSFPQIRA